MAANDETNAVDASELDAVIAQAVADETAPLFALLEKGGGTDRGEVNMPLARQFARAVAKLGEDGDALIETMSSMRPIRAPANSAKEFIPVCGYIAHGERAASDATRIEAALAAINDRACVDRRPRLHDAATAAIARMGEAYGPKLLVDRLSKYLKTSDFDSFIVNALVTPQWLDTFASPEPLVEKLDQCFQELAKAPPGWDALATGQRQLRALEAAPAILAKKFPDAMVGFLKKWSSDTGRRVPGVVAANVKALSPELATRVSKP